MCEGVQVWVHARRRGCEAPRAIYRSCEERGGEGGSECIGAFTI